MKYKQITERKYLRRRLLMLDNSKHKHSQIQINAYFCSLKHYKNIPVQSIYLIRKNF